MKQVNRDKIKAFLNFPKNKIISFFNFIKTTESPIDQIDVYLLSGIGFITHGVSLFGTPYSFIVCGVLLISLGLLITWRSSK